MSKPELWAIVGGNGAGKSTFYQLFLQPQAIPFINADIIAQELFSQNHETADQKTNSPEAASYYAAELAGLQREQAIRRNQNFCFETVFSHPSKVDLLAQAKAAGYEINLVVIYVCDVEINKARVRQRVSEGGHDVPDDKIESRIPRAHKNISVAVDLCDCVYIFDNSSFDKPFEKIASKEKAGVTFYKEAVPDWLTTLFS